MSNGFFGTDGIRGRVGDGPLSPPQLLRIGLAAAGVLVPSVHAGDRVVIGIDTRQSGPAIADILAAAFANLGLDVVLLGILPTPALSRAVQEHGAQFGVMVTASHNPAGDNGLKFFGADGFKLSEANELAIERAIGSSFQDLAEGPTHTGAVGPDPSIDVRASYADAMIKSLPEGASLAGLSVVLDGAHGAGFDIAPYVLRRLSATVRTIGCAPNGQNINDQVGSTHPAALAKAVRAFGAHAGLALDGDGDRLIMVDERGETVDGDQLIGLLAGHLKERGLLTGETVVATVMSNLGLERHLRGLGVSMLRTPVGDKHVVEAMRAGGYALGGEPSGHIVMLDHGTTGDGLLAAVQVLAIANARGGAVSEVASVFEPAPQALENIRFAGANPLDDPGVQSVIKDVEAGLGEAGRLVVRKSGTEPKIRVMAEALNAAEMAAALERVVAAVKAVAERGA
ncbi:MAG: phosphoglucosamine mutase [Pseudomonadota bacterium]